MEIIGIIVQKMNERSGISQSNGQAWKSAEYLIEMPSMNNPKHMVVSVMDGLDGRIARFDAMLGKTAKVRFDIDAREYQGRWYNDVRGYGVSEYTTNAGTTNDGTSAPLINGGFGPSNTPGKATQKEQ